jgi:hypothetical protein
VKLPVDGIQASPINSRSIVSVLTICLVCLLPVAALTTARAETILVTDMQYGPQNLGGLFLVDGTGTRSLLSDFGDPAQGPLGRDPVGVAVGPKGVIWVVDISAGASYRGALFRIDAYGMRTLVSDFGNSPAQGPIGMHPYAIVPETSGQVLVVDQDTGSDGLCRYGLLFRVDPETGIRTVLSNFCDAAQGPLVSIGFSVAVETSGHALVCDAGQIVKIDPSTGYRTLLSDLRDPGQGPTGLICYDVAVEPSGTILVATHNAGTNHYGAIFRVNATNGNRVLLSDFGDSAQGGIAQPLGMKVTPSGQILAILTTGGTSNCYAVLVDSTTGARTMISDFTNPSQGPLGVLPYKVTAGTIAPPSGAPRAPSNLEAKLGVGSRGSDVILHWNDNSLNEDHFEIWRSEDGGTTFGTSAYATTTASYIVDENVRITYPVPEFPYYPANYCYKVRAFNSYGASDFCDTKCPLLPPAKREEFTASGIPAPPSPRVVLSWANPDYGHPPTMIKIGRSLDPLGPFFAYHQISYETSANGIYEDTGVVAGQQYCYEIVATNGSSIASRSLPNQACATVPQALMVYNFTYRVRPTGVTFTWDTNVTTVGEVSVNGGPLIRSHGVGTHHTVVLRPLVAQTTYSFDIVAARTADPHDAVHQTGTFTTPDPGTYLYISSVDLSTTATSTTITWRTSQSANGTVEYGTGDAGSCTYTSTLPSGANTTHHSTTISGLVPDNQYCYRLVAARGSDTDNYTNTFVTAGMPRLEIRSVSGPFLRGYLDAQADTSPYFMEYRVLIGNNSGRTAITANHVAVIANATTLEVPCDQLRDPLICASSVETVLLSLSPPPPVDIPAGESGEVSLIFPVRVPPRGFIGTGANLRVRLAYQYPSGSDTISTTSDFAASVPLQRFGLSVTLLGPPDPVPLGSLVTYTFKITNGGMCETADEPCPATRKGVRLTWDSLIWSFINVRLDYPGSCTQDVKIVECSLPDLPTGDVATGQLTLRPPVSAQQWDNFNPLGVRAEVSTYDPYPWDYFATEFTTVETTGSTIPSLDITYWVRGAMTSYSPISCVAGYPGILASFHFCDWQVPFPTGVNYTDLRLVPQWLPPDSYIEAPLPWWSFYFPRVLGYVDGVLGPGECVDISIPICNLSDVPAPGQEQSWFHVWGRILP